MTYFDAAQEAYETPPDDDEEQKHSPYCSCEDCEAYEADRYYDRMRDEEYD